MTIDTTHGTWCQNYLKQVLLDTIDSTTYFAYGMRPKRAILFDGVSLVQAQNCQVSLTLA